MIQKSRLIERFVRYVQIDTTADPSSEKYPSSEGQWKLGTMLTNEMKEMGLSDVHQDEFGLVWGTLPGNVSNAPTVLLNAHMDTSPEAPGNNIQPQQLVYRGGAIPLLKQGAIDPKDTPELAGLVGHTLITTDGTTLLGGDDKAGIAAILELVNTLVENPSLPHGPVRVLFTCDEEIGLGTKHFSVAKANAAVGYTLDGGGAGNIDVETFSADQATITFTGHNTHPSVGKDKMVNALRAASRFVDSMPRSSLSPESTSARQGFMHPYKLDGGVGRSVLQVLLRNFDTSSLKTYADHLSSLARIVEADFPGLQIEVTITEQYRNMGDALRGFPLSIDLAEKAFAIRKWPCKRDIIRGGTDGALMSAMGLPTPNLSVGQFNIHSTKEFVSVDMMVQAAEHVITLLELWSKQSPTT